MTSPVDELLYPVLLVRRAGAWTASNIDELVTTQRTLLGIYEGVLIDSSGRAHRVSRAELDLPGGWLARFRASFNHLIRARLIFEGEPWQMSLAEVKQMLAAAVQNRPNFSGESFGPRLQAADSLKSLYGELANWDQTGKDAP